MKHVLDKSARKKNAKINYDDWLMVFMAIKHPRHYYA